MYRLTGKSFAAIPHRCESQPPAVHWTTSRAASSPASARSDPHTRAAVMGVVLSAGMAMRFQPGTRRTTFDPGESTSGVAVGDGGGGTTVSRVTACMRE